MNHLPRLFADYLTLWRDIVRFPRQVLLNRSHSIASITAIGGFCAVDLLIAHPFATAVTYLALAVFVPSAIVSVAGSVAHSLWDRGLIWADIECEWCGDDPDDDGPDDALGPEDPDDPHGLIREIKAYLSDQHTLALTR
ncbi:hypothetical protein [Streptomyces sp. NBC_01506]|uniref:hypothetical protein n=1 Tax=Streptomyces sp. NBC_01506 TaxID=2903887 RepID=UPI0038660E14